MKRYAEFFGRHRPIVAAFVVIMTTLAAFGLRGLEFDDVARGIFESDDEEHARLAAFYDEFGSDDNDALVVLEADDWFEPQNANLLRGAVEAIRGLEGIESVFGLPDVPVFDAGLLPRSLVPAAGADPAVFAMARERALEHPLVAGRLLSADGRTTLIVARLAGGALGIEDIEPVVDELNAIAAELGGRAEIRARVTGIPPIRVEIYGTIRSEQVLFTGLGGVLSLIIAWLLFRSPGAVLSACVPPGLGAFWALGFIGLAGQRIDLLGTVLPMLVIVIGLTDAVHLVIDVRHSRAAGASALAAAVDAIRHVGLPCGLTSLTTAVGFGSLMVANVPMIRRFGLLAAASVLLAFLAVVTTAPLLASVFGSVGAPREARGARRWADHARRLIDWIVAHALGVSAAGVALTLALSLVALRLEPENRLTEALPRGEAFEALMHCEEAFGGVLPVYVVVEWGVALDAGSEEVLATLGDVEELLRGLDHVAAPVSILGVLGTVPGGRANPVAALALLPDDLVRRFVRLDLSKAVVVAYVADRENDVMVPLFERIERGLDEIVERRPSIGLHLTGTDPIARTNVNRMIIDLARSLGFAAVIIFGIIALEFRSVRLGVISLVPNLFPLVAIGAGLALTGRPLQMSSAVLFTVLLGLAVDDTIHVLARVRRERASGSDPRTAIRRSFVAVGQAIVLTTVVLEVGFATVFLSSVPTNQLFAVLVCLGLVAALMGDLILLPALLALGARGRDHA